jgi:hypothetical protein
MAMLSRAPTSREASNHAIDYLLVSIGRQNRVFARFGRDGSHLRLRRHV